MSDGGKIELTCTGCNTLHKLPSSAAGKTLGCPACGADLSVPAAGESSSAGEEEYVNPFSPDASEPPKKEESGYVNPFDPSKGEVPDSASGEETFYRGEEGEKDENAPHFQKPEGPPPDFYRLINRAFSYPFSGGVGVLFVLFMGGMVAIGRGAASMPFFFASIAGVVTLFIAWGYIASYMWAILNASALNDHRLPQVPDVTSFSDVFWEAVRLFFASLWAFFPAGLIAAGPFLLKWEEFYASIPHLSMVGAAFLFGVIYYPISLLIVGFANSMFAPLNYIYGVRLMFRAPKEYAVCVLYFIGTVLGVGSFEYALGSIVGDNLLLMIASFPVVAAAEIYLYMIQIRVLGSFYLCKSRELSFFGEKEREAELKALREDGGR